MEKRSRSYSVKLKPAVLHFDDLERIIEMFEQISSDLEISTKEYRFENIEEVKKIAKETINSLAFDTYGPGLSLHLDPDGIYLFVRDETPALRGVFEAVKQFLHSRRRKLVWMYHPIFWFLAPSTIGASSWFLFPGISKKNPYLIIAGCACMILGAIWVWWAYRVDFRRYSTIYLKRQIESPSFWKDKKDQIILVIISAVIGSFITVVLTKLLK